METFSALLAICAGNSPVPGEFPTQRPMTRSFDVYFDLRPNKRLSKQSWGWWFETPSRPLWRHRNATTENRHRVNPRLAPSQWETSLQSNAVSHWLGANLESDSRLAPSQWERSLQSNATSHWLGTNLESACLNISYIQHQQWCRMLTHWGLHTIVDIS